MKHTMVPSDDAAWTKAVGGTGLRDQPPVLRLPGPRAVEGAGHLHRQVGTKYANTTVNDLFTKAAATGDATARNAIYTQIGEILNTDLPYDWLWAVAHTDAYTDKLTPIIYPNARESFASGREVDARAVAVTR